MHELKKNVTTIIIGVIVFVVLGFILNKLTEIKYAELSIRYNEFYVSDLEGIITYLNGSGGRFYFKIGNDETKYFVSPHLIDPEKGTFSEVASVGSFFKKPAFSDKIIIKKNGEVYEYSFRDYSN